MASTREQLDSLAARMGNSVKGAAKAFPGGAADTLVKGEDALSTGISKVKDAGESVKSKASKAFDELKGKVKSSVPNLGPRVKEPLD